MAEQEKKRRKTKQESSDLLDVKDDYVPDMLRNMTQEEQPQVPRVKPNMTPVVASSSVLQRVCSFLPKLKEANESLDEEIKSCPEKSFNIEDVEDGERHIEMNLFPGVLEDQNIANSPVVLSVGDDGTRHPGLEEIDPPNGAADKVEDDGSSGGDKDGFLDEANVDDA